MKRKIKVMLVVDHPECHNVLKYVLKDDLELELVGVFGSAEYALSSLRNQTDDYKPDIILLDLNLPGMSSFEAVGEFTKQLVYARIIILSNSRDVADVESAVSAGISGYLMKSARTQEVIDSIKLVYNGGTVLDPFVIETIMNMMRANPVKLKVKSSLSKRIYQLLFSYHKGSLGKRSLSRCT